MRGKAWGLKAGTLVLVAILSITFAATGCFKKPQQAQQNPQAQTQPPGQQTPPVIPPENVQDTTNPRPEGETWVYSDKREYRTGEIMQIEYKVKRGETGKPWIGLIPVGIEALDEATNDANDIAYIYLEDLAATGKVELKALKKGDYHLRLFGSDSDEKAFSQGQTRTVFIRDWPQGNLEGGRLPLVSIEGQPTPVAGTPPAPMTFKAGAVVKGTYTLSEAYPDTAWLGLIPWEVKNRGADANDAADVAYKYLDKGVLTGTYEFTLEKPGEYVLRLFPCSEGDPTATFQSVKLVVE
jgi:hypothetical protein